MMKLSDALLSAYRRQKMKRRTCATVFPAFPFPDCLCAIGARGINYYDFLGERGRSLSGAVRLEWNLHERKTGRWKIFPGNVLASLERIMDCRADFNCEPTQAPHTGRYLWEHIISLCEVLRARRVVDIGCGNGALCRELASRGYEVVGCEPNVESLHFAQLAAPGLIFHRLGVDDDPSIIGNRSFDVAIATEVIEHLVRPFNLPHFAKQLLRPGGHLIISTPYHGYLKNLVLALTNKWDAHLNPFWDGGHIKFWSYKTLSQLLNESGFRVVRFIGAGRLPFLWKSMIIVAQKLEGSEDLINGDSPS